MNIQQQPFRVPRPGNFLPGHRWEPEEPSAAILLVHGLGEHHARYEQMAQFLGKQGFAVAGFDLPGHGEAAGKRGHFDFDALMLDIECALNTLADHYPNLPMFLFGHSMGGNLAASYVLQAPAGAPPLAGLILSSPWLDLAFEPSRPLVMVGRLMARLSPSFTQKNQIDPNWLSRDESVGKAYLADPLVHQRISAGVFSACERAGKKVQQQAQDFSLPVLVMHGTDDKITSTVASRRFANRLPVGDFQCWKGLRHEPHHEPEKEEVCQFLADWLQAHLPMDAQAVS